MENKESKTSFIDKELTRRDFLKVSGKGIAGIAITASLLSLIGCTEEQVSSGEVAVWATPKGVLVAERARCTGCQRCETSCTTLNDGKVSAYSARVRVRPHFFFGDDGVGSGGGLYGDLNFSPITCRQCAEPACGIACPQDAIYACPDTGARKVDNDKCIGCGACVTACPWQVPVVDPETNKSTKCITCGECASACPTGALKIIDWEDLTV